MMKFLYRGLLPVMLVLVLWAQPVFAHGAVYDIAYKKDGKTAVITLKWTESGKKGIALSYYYLKNGKTLVIGYKAKEKGPASVKLEYDLSGAIAPIRVVLARSDDPNWLPFGDIQGIAAEENIRHLHDAGILSGGAGGKYQPRKSMTRADFAVMLARSLKLTGTAANDKKLKDIDKSPAKKEILLVVKRGLMAGDSKGKFNPGSPIRLADVCMAVSKGFSFKTAKNGIYDKIKPGKSYTAHVKKLFDAGVLNTDDELYRRFDEEAPAQRGDCAMILSRALSTY